MISKRLFSMFLTMAYLLSVMAVSSWAQTTNTKKLYINSSFSVSRVVKGICIHNNYNINNIRQIRIRKAEFSNSTSLYVNQVYFNEVLVASEGYTTKALAMSNLENYIAIDKKDKGLSMTIYIEWNAITSTEVKFDLRGTRWKDITNSSNKSQIERQLLTGKKNIKKARNALIESKQYTKARFLDSPDGKRTEFKLPDFLSSVKTLIVYQDGKVLRLHDHYEVVQHHDLVVFKNPPAKNSDLSCTFNSKKEVFTHIINTTDMKTSIVSNTPNKKTVFRFTGNNRSNSWKEFNKYGVEPMYFSSEGGNGYIVEMTNDPLDRKASAIHFKHGTPVPDKALAAPCSRLQNHVSKEFGTNRLVCDMDILLPESMGLLKSFPHEIDWLTIQEYWNGRSPELVSDKDAGPHDTQIRLTLGILKDNGAGKDLHFELWAEDDFLNGATHPKMKKNEVKLINKSFAIPFGEWVRLHIEIIPGDEEHGTFILTATTKDGMEHKIFNDHIRTICERMAYEKTDIHEGRNLGKLNFKETKRPVYEDFSTMKLYTSAMLQNYLRGKGKNMEIYFKNYRLECVSAVEEE